MFEERLNSRGQLKAIWFFFTGDSFATAIRKRNNRASKNINIVHGFCVCNCPQLTIWRLGKCFVRVRSE